jgi:hypothetical protein
MSAMNSATSIGIVLLWIAVIALLFFSSKDDPIPSHMSQVPEPMPFHSGAWREER